MNTSSSTYSKRSRISQELVLLDAIGTEIDSFDISTNAYFKLALFLNIPSGSPEISGSFNFIFKIILARTTKYSFSRFFLFFSYSYFKKRFVYCALEEIKSRRAQWLLDNCAANELAALDAKATQHYFLTLERKAFENYINGWNNLQNILKIEFENNRKNTIVRFIKKYFHFFIFWSLVVLAVYLGLKITATENSLTIWEQLKEFYNFMVTF